MPAPFNPDAPDGPLRAIIRRNPDNMQEVELLRAVWGSDPSLADGASLRFIRSEGGDFTDRRCLVAASEFHMNAGRKLYRARLESGGYFYLAALWTPAISGWPLSYRIATVPANAEVARHQQRHGAIVGRREAMRWLDPDADPGDFLRTPPDGTFRVEQIAPPLRQPALAL